MKIKVGDSVKIINKSVGRPMWKVLYDKGIVEEKFKHKGEEVFYVRGFNDDNNPEFALDFFSEVDLFIIDDPIMRKFSENYRKITGNDVLYMFDELITDL